MAIRRVFIPFKEFLPDARALGNPGLRRAWGVIPFYGNYLVSPGWLAVSTGLGKAFGSHFHQKQSSTLGMLNFAYHGEETKLFEHGLFSGGVLNSDVSGAVYGFGTGVKFWDFASYGPNVIATNFANPVQYTDSPGINNFSDLITSTFKPQARFVFSIRQNLFLANLKVLSAYGGLAAANHPSTVAWSQNDNIRAFGSPSVDPALLGSGFQPLGNDFGPITAAIGGDFGILFHVKGITRIDGPPYEFRDLSASHGCVQPDSVVRVDEDIYFWGTRGPSVLRGGEAPVVVLSEGALTRSLLDDQTGFSEIAATLDFGSASAVFRRVHVAVDTVNGIIRWSYQPFGDTDFSTVDASGNVSGAFLDYNYLEGRFGVSDIPEDDLQCWGLGSFAPLDNEPWNPMAGCHAILAGVAGTPAILARFEIELNPKPDVVFQTGLIELSEETTTRPKRLRPVYAKKAAATDVTTSVRLTAVNDPKDDEVSYGPFTTYDSDGWIPTPSSVWANLHSFEASLDPDDPEAGDGENIFEFEGVEVEFDDAGGAYGS